MTAQTSRLPIILLTVAGLLMIPLIAMQFTDEVQWGFFDFLVMGILLLATGLSIDFIARKVRNRQNRILMILGAIFAFLLIWAELAVGIFT